MKLVRYIGLIIMVTAVIVVTGCSTKSDVSTDQPVNSEVPQLTVYLNDFDDIIGPMFEEATGYSIQLIQGSGGEILSRIEAERGNPHWDVVWVDMISSVHGLGLNGMLLEDYIPEHSAKLKEEYQHMVPEQKWYYPTGAHAAGIIVYNRNALTIEEAPSTWEDFSKPAFNNAVGMADPAVAAPAFPFVNWFFQHHGMEEGKALITSWFDNGLYIYPKNPNVAMALLSGQIKVAALQETNAYQLLKEKEPVSIVWPNEGAPAAVRVAAISKDTKNVEAAQAFVNFLLDPAVQQQIVEKSDDAYHEPSAAGVTTKPDRDPHAKLLFTDPLASYEQESEIKQWFADHSIN